VTIHPFLSDVAMATDGVMCVSVTHKRTNTHTRVSCVCIHNFVPNQVDCVRDVHAASRDKKKITIRAF
jgi:hypothetical protein